MAADFRIRPLADRVVVKPAEREEQTKGGIYLPDTASKERPAVGCRAAAGWTSDRTWGALEEDHPPPHSIADQAAYTISVEWE